MTSPAEELALQFAGLNDYLFEGGDAGTARHRLVELAVSAVPGCDWAGMTSWPEHRKPRSLASSSEIAEAVDQLQHSIGDGPCMTAARRDEFIRVTDVTTETRWPAYIRALIEQSPVRAVLSFHLNDKSGHSALNLYSATPYGFDDDAAAIAALFAAHARVLIAHAASADAADNLKEALGTSRQIGAAVGVLMAIRRVDEQSAFELLRISSQHLNRKLRDIARDVTETGTLPDVEML